MTYPNNYEKKIGFDSIRQMLRGNCLCNMGCELVNTMAFMEDIVSIRARLMEVREFRRLKEEEEELPLQYFFDIRECIARLRLKGTHLEEQELFDLQRSLETIEGIRQCLAPKEDDEELTTLYPTLWEKAREVRPFKEVVRRIIGILDKYGHMKDTASKELAHIRQEMRHTESSISHILTSILRSAQQEGLIEKDTAPTMRDGRLVLPIAPALKKRIPGIVHDESATGKTVFVEPTAVVDANNRIHELKAEERREVIRILTEVSDELRPNVEGLLESIAFLAEIDFIQAKEQLAMQFGAIEPEINDKPAMDWVQAIHPLLKHSLERQGRNVVPLDIKLTADEGRMLIISGPNAGGKSVCLKTVGLLQYMVQCGLSVPMKENSTMGVFKNIMIDIGDEQSIEDDLSTYSSHLMNMKMMIRHSNDATLLLIDEFGTGTEPQIGGAIAEAVLRQLWRRKAWGVITTHYQNLKHFAEDHPGVINGAMLYDRHEMKALFQLQTGRPGSSFAIEIARKTGLPEEVINDASEIVGQDYIQSDKYLQDIVRDKRYWEQKRQTVHQREKDIEKTITRYESSVEEIESERKAIIRRAQQQAEELLKEANRRIENTIREIREAEAEKEATRRAREEMEHFREEIKDIDSKANDAAIEKKMAQIMARKERQQKRKQEKAEKQQAAGSTAITTATAQEGEIEVMREGNFVRIKGTKSVGLIESIKGKTATVIIGDMKTKMPVERLEQSSKPKEQQQEVSVTKATRMTREVMDSRRETFKQELDVRGMRGDEALLEVQRFIDDAIMVGSTMVRILHGKGNGILRQLIRQYLSTVPNVLGYRDEHVQFGGAGITVVDFE
jgi:DNA mismatch repair protein MutS2